MERRLRQTDLDKLGKEFSDLDSSTLSSLVDLSGQAICRNICHFWYDEITWSKVVYCGHIEKLKRRNSDKYVVTYWADGEY